MATKDEDEVEFHDALDEAFGNDDNEKHSDVKEEIKECELTEEEENLLTDDEKKERHQVALNLKSDGNSAFKSEEYETAIKYYSEAIFKCPPSFKSDRAVFYANRAACYMKTSKNDDSLTDCNKALELNPQYLKALTRRAQTYEALDKLEDALEDYQTILQKDCSIGMARAAVLRLPDQIKERNEKLKEEMMGKLKDLGNMFLKPFGLSTNNFQFQKNPDNDSYSVNFQK